MREPGRLWPRVILLAAMAGRVIAQSGVLVMSWSTDEPAASNGSTFGPDGPWQAVIARVGTPQSIGSVGWRGDEWPFFPSDYMKTRVLTKIVGGRYDPTGNQSNAKDLSGREGQTGPKFKDHSGKWYLDAITPKIKQGMPPTVNVPILAVDSVGFPPNNTLPGTPDPVGILGLGPGSDSGPNLGPSFLQALKNADQIRSETFGFHLGSVAVLQSGSMILGGYDQSRALGEVAVFDRTKTGQSKVFLLDVIMGVETGGTPFEFAGTTSVYRGVSEIPGAEDYASNSGGTPGAAIAALNPAWPYLGLPPSTCKAIADQLPVKYDKRLQLFLWDTENPKFATITNSPAYLGFVFADRAAKNVTIKVPFKLLNLTLEAPLVNGMTLQYFPCAPSTDYYPGVYLGRAFFQAAFWGVSYERNLTFLAQAPGPGVSQSVIRAITPSMTTILTSDASSFQKTWEGHWTPLPGTNGQNSTAVSSLSTGGIVGITLGALVVLVAAAAAGFFFVRRRRRQHEYNAVEAAELSGTGAPGISGGELVELSSAKKQPHEMYPPNSQAHELLSPGHDSYELSSPTKNPHESGGPQPHEMHAPREFIERDTQVEQKVLIAPRYELP